MAWYNNIGDLAGDVKSIITGHNPSNNPPPSPIPAAGPGGVSGMQPIPMGGSQLGSTQPVLPNVSGIPGAGDSGSGGIDWGSIISKIPGWVVDGIKTGLPAAADWLKNNAGTLLQGAGIADAAYREMQADKYATQAYKQAQDAYNAKAPLRSSGIQGMLMAGQANPFARAAGSAPALPSLPQPAGLPMAGEPANPTPPGGLPGGRVGKLVPLALR